MSPDGQWDIISDISGDEPGNQSYYLLNRFEQEKVYIPELPKSPRLDVVWSRDSQWIAMFADPAGRNIYTYHIPTGTLDILEYVQGYPHNANYFVSGYADRLPAWASWSYDNEWILYSSSTDSITAQNSRTFFSIIHRDGEPHFQGVIGAASHPKTPFWAQWLRPEPPQELNWLYLLTLMLIMFVAGFGMRRLRLNIERKAFQS